jgi:hypothetical protein
MIVLWPARIDLLHEFDPQARFQMVAVVMLAANVYLGHYRTSSQLAEIRQGEPIDIALQLGNNAVPKFVSPECSQ